MFRAARRTVTPASCSRCRCGWRCASNRCGSSAATCTGWTLPSISPPRSRRWRGRYESRSDGAPLILFGPPDDDAAQITATIQIPKLAYGIPTGDCNVALRGLRPLPASGRPPAELVFRSFRIMLATGFAMLGLGAGRWSRAFSGGSPWRWLQAASAEVVAFPPAPA
ncbi:MAG TPA: cytochrome ubiquinol oxidase subunit I, partial [Paracoccaceae bacterium]|nr:cytochrome ubiquinol oxidase subunit I [Paracoccaceae bacterium]